MHGCLGALRPKIMFALRAKLIRGRPRLSVCSFKSMLSSKPTGYFNFLAMMSEKSPKRLEISSPNSARRGDRGARRTAARSRKRTSKEGQPAPQGFGKSSK
jgi:hypothetical protein